MRKRAASAFVLLLIVCVAGQPAGREVRLTLHEGTSMAAAVSPDGRSIAIDLLGELWVLPIDGGTAHRILGDGYDARMPAWSPDGTRIAFQGYRDSTWNIWTIKPDGSELKRLTSGPYDDREPHWGPDGATIAFASDRTGNYDIWTIPVAESRVRGQESATPRGGPELRQITANAANDFAPAWSPDGTQIAFVSDRKDRPGVYAVDAGGQLERFIVTAPGTIGQPSWSPDGKTVAFSVVQGAMSRLMIGGANIADANEDVFPFRVHWLSSNEVLYTADGRIKRRSTAGGAARIVDFAAQVAFTRPAFTPRARSLAPQHGAAARGIMHPAISPDGTTVAFAAVGDLWTVPVSCGAPLEGGDALRASTVCEAGEPTRLTNDVFVDTDPAWSPDGASLLFSSDRDGSMDLWIRDMRSGRDRKLTSRGMSAAWSPDGTQIAFLNPDSELQVVDLQLGVARKVHERLNEPGRPSWAPDGTAIVVSALEPYSTRFREGTNQVLRVSLDGQPDRWFHPVPHKSTGMREDFGPVWSPDGSQMAAVIDGHLAAFTVGADGTPVGPPRRLSPGLANSPSWTADSRRVLYQGDDRLTLVDVTTGARRDVQPRVPAASRPATGRMTVHAGRLFDGRGAAARENVDVVIEANRMTQVEPHRAELHQGTLVDASNQTVMPGLIESHAHLSKAYGESLGRIWLAFGITSVRNPATNAFEGQEDREAIESGRRIGPRVFTTGEPFDGTRIYYPGGTALDGGVQVDEQLARARSLQFDFIKTYVRLPDALQERIVVEAHRAGLPVTSHELYPAVAYGADGVEHIRGTSRRGYSPKVTALMRSYRDVVDLLTASRMTLTPTIGIQGGNQLLTLRDAAWIDDVRIQRLFPTSVWRPIRAFADRPRDAGDLAAREALVGAQERLVAQVIKGGGRVIAGTDSPILPYGLALLMELEHYVRGGVTPAEAIRTATAVPAEAMGLAADLGTIAAGKLADLTIVDGNPLQDIRDIRRTRRVIKDGVLYDVDALLRGPWQRPASSANHDDQWLARFHDRRSSPFEY